MTTRNKNQTYFSLELFKMSYTGNWLWTRSASYALWAWIQTQIISLTTYLVKAEANLKCDSFDLYFCLLILKNC